jgi:hypothetical protein
MRQKRLKKVEDLEKGRLPPQTGSTSTSPAPKPQTNPGN